MSDLLGSGIADATPQQIRAALDALPEGATLFKLYVTGNLAVLLGDEQIGFIDLQTGEFDDWREPDAV